MVPNWQKCHNFEVSMKQVHWVGSSLHDLRKLPDAVQDEVGFALHEVQMGRKPGNAKPLKGFKGAGVLEIVQGHDGEAYRAIYTVRLVSAIYVLHVFHKKSKHGVATPKAEIDLIKQRLKAAEDIEKGSP
jgi:phage-related protein